MAVLILLLQLTNQYIIQVAVPKPDDITNDRPMGQAVCIPRNPFPVYRRLGEVLVEEVPKNGADLLAYVQENIAAIVSGVDLTFGHLPTGFCSGDVLRTVPEKIKTNKELCHRRYILFKRFY